MPRLVEALAGKTIVSVAAGDHHTAVWTEAGELFTFGLEGHGRLGHGRTQTERVPRLIEALAGKKVIGAAGTTQPCGPMQASSSPLGLDNMGSWATEGKRLSLCRGWLQLKP